MPALAAIGLIASLASAGYGMYKQSQASKEARGAMDEQNARMNDLSSWYNAESSKDFLDTEVAQSTLGRIREQYKKGVETNASNAARGGATAEAKVANKASLNEKYNQVLNNMVGHGTQYKLNLKKGYSDALGKLASGQNSMNMADVASWQNMTANAGESAVDILGSTDWTQKGW